MYQIRNSAERGVTWTWVVSFSPDECRGSSLYLKRPSMEYEDDCEWCGRFVTHFKEMLQHFNRVADGNTNTCVR
jgi:hypothetical protein